MNVPFIHLVNRENVYFMRGFMKYECFASLDEINGIFMAKEINFLFIIYNFKRDRLFALNDAIHVRTLRHIYDDVA